MANERRGRRPVARILTSCALLLLLWGRGSANAPTTVRVLTYNIHHGEGRDGLLDLSRLSQVIISAQPDLVALQEVDIETTRVGGVNQLDTLAQLTGMHAKFGKAMDYMGGGYGVAVLSRWPVVGTVSEALPSSPDREPRTELTVEVRAGSGGPLIQFTSTHLDQGRPEDRLVQAEYLNELLIRDDVPGILAGDMNARPNTEVMKIFEPWWTVALPFDPGATTTPPRPLLRGDHVLFRPYASWRQVESRFIDDTVASDHRPVLVVLEWLGPQDSSLPISH
jgi:endonuclease/exonuclease/phosphatase family metal-dependent hydrolase